MGGTVRCGSCGFELNEAPDLPPENREPCPNCGSKARHFNEIAVAAFTLSTAASENVFSPRASTLLLKAVVVPADKADRGELVKAVTIPWYEIVEAVTQNPALAHQIPSRRWEEIVAGAYSRAGFEEVILTPRSGDYGRDVIAVKRGIGVVRVIDSVKAYGPGNLVPADDVRALMGILQTDGAAKGFLTTTSDFAPGIRQDPLIVPLIPARLELVNGQELLSRLRELGQGKNRA